jgi:GAF domain-containing protein
MSGTCRVGRQRHTVRQLGSPSGSADALRAGCGLVRQRRHWHNLAVMGTRSTDVSLRRRHTWAGFVVCAVVALADSIGGPTLILIPLMVVAPLVASVRAQPRDAAAVAVVAAAIAVALGWVDDIAGTRRHWVAIATTVLGGVLAVWLAAARETRDRQLVASAEIVRATDRLKASLATGKMGEWSWNRTTGTVRWDEHVSALFGLALGEFRESFDAWIELIDPRDRELVRDTVLAAVEDRQTFRFDHRCIWPDGTIHWIEGIGDLVIDDNTNEVSGAFGLAVDIDDRQRQVEERTRLVDFERRQRHRAEFLASINDVLARSVDIDEIVQRVTNTVIPDLAEWCSVVVSVDRPRSRPSIVVAHRDPDKVRWAEQVQQDYPYDPDASWGAARVIRTGRPEVIPRVDPRVFSLPGGDVLAEAGLASVATVSLVGPLGTLGALQLIRCDKSPPFSTTDLELVDEIAGRVGAALNTAVLFQRQTRSRIALDTLQEVSGHIASVATAHEVVHAALVHGARGINALSATAFLVGDDGELAARESVGGTTRACGPTELEVARRSIDEGRVVTGASATDSCCRRTVGVSMRIMNRTVGSLVFTFDDERELTHEEASMLTTLGSRCAGALERASLYERERTIALTLQHRLLSVLPDTPDWLEVAGCYVPATGLEIGGDWFQILDVTDGRVAAIIGDAVGHGLASAAAMGQLRASFATAVANDPEPHRVLAAVDLFAGRGADTLAASAAYLLLDSAGSAVFASAGHPPLIWAPAQGPPRIIEEGRGPLLGFRGGRQSGTTSIPFNTGDLIVMFTDGLIERRREPIDDGLLRLANAVADFRHLAPQSMCDALVAACTESRAPSDDIAVLLLRRT